MVVPPLLMAASYIAISYPRFCPDISFIWEHLYVLSVWLTTTVVLMFFVRELLVRARLRFVLLPAVIIPVLSFFSLYFIYTCALLGNFSWGVLPSYRFILLFLPHLFELADNFGIPRFFVILSFIFPFVLFILIFQSRIREMVIWHWCLRESFLQLRWRHRLSFTAVAVLAWLFFLASLWTADPAIRKFGDFSYDPIVNFFKRDRSFFPMTAERVLAVQKDRQFEKYMRPKPPRVHNIILIVVDALRADHLPVYGYPRPLTPFLSGFLPKAHYRKVGLALSNGFDTLTGLQCLLSSKEPWAVSRFNYTLADFLSGNGFENDFALAGGHGWQKKHRSFGKRIDYFYDGSENPGPDGVCDDEVALRGLAFLKPDNGGYHFIYVHLISVHQLSNLHPPFERYTPMRNVLNLVFKGGQDAEGLIATANMYDDRILQMDDSLRKVFSILGQKGYLRDYVGVFTGDHGQLLGEKGRFGHGFYATLGGMRIPLIFFGSKPLPPLVQTRFGVQVDIAPTLADMAGLGLVPCWQGQSLLRPRTNHWSIHYSVISWEGREEAVVYSENGNVFKYARSVGGNPREQSENLYDLEKDPLENDNLIGHSDPKFLGQFRREAEEHFSKY
jgi:glucan phosphoethanolaminetransferase (alkaline phosphatase superfamily)